MTKAAGDENRVLRPFERVDIPRRHRRSSLNCHARWYTWSAEVRHLLPAWKLHLSRFPQPTLVQLDNSSHYGTSYTVDLGSADSVFMEELRSLARGLAGVGRPRHVMLLTGLCHELDSSTLHLLLASVRAALAEELGAGDAALYAPLGTTGDDIGAFPLHADLYRAQMLWVIFDDVPTNHSGASLFAPVSLLFDSIDRAGVPEDIRHQIEVCFDASRDQDSFDQLFSLLYSGRDGWRSELRRRLRAGRLQIKLFRGEGYLIHDRTWLHGRTKPDGGVNTNRLHRLVFDPRSVDHLNDR